MKLGKTNIESCSNTGSGSSNGDVILPAQLTSISSVAGDGKVTLNISYGSTSYVTGVMVRYQTGSYPSGVTNGYGKTVNGAPTSITISGLTNGSTYYFRVFLYRQINEVKYYQTSIYNAQISDKPAGFNITGTTPYVLTENYAVVASSCNFTLNVPPGHRINLYMVSGGRDGEPGTEGSMDSDDAYNGQPGCGGDGGRYIKYSNISVPETVSCSLSVGKGGYNLYDHDYITTLKIGSTVYSTSSGSYATGGSNGGSGKNGILTPYGYIGSSGGSGGLAGSGSVSGGAGAGRGGAGGNYNNVTYADGKDGGNATGFGSGGGGGGAGAANFSWLYDECGLGGSGGSGKHGCAIIELN